MSRNPLERIHVPGNERDARLEAAIEQSMRMAPAQSAQPRTNHVLRLEIVNLGLDEAGNLIIIPTDGSKLVDRYDAIQVALPPEYAAGFAKHWHEHTRPPAYEGSTSEPGSEED